MSVIIHKPIGLDIDRDILHRCWKHNPHGAGFMYAENGVITIVKGLMKLDDFVMKYDDHNGINKNLIVHFRFATSGRINQEQTHPFWVFKDKLAFAHNGHISEHFDCTKIESDTIVFNREILSKLPDDFLKIKPIVKLINCYIVNSSLVFLDKNGQITFLGNINESTCIDDVWYSNTYWMNSLISLEENELEDDSPVVAEDDPSDEDKISKAICETCYYDGKKCGICKQCVDYDKWEP